jgi:hypothetical protein
VKNGVCNGKNEIGTQDAILQQQQQRKKIFCEVTRVFVSAIPFWMRMFQYSFLTRKNQGNSRQEHCPSPKLPL